MFDNSAKEKKLSQASTTPIKVMLVDDSSVVRGFLSRIIDSVDDVEVVGAVINGQQAIDMVGRYNPDIVILDIEMPVMDGITALPKIIEKSPASKVLMCSTLSTKNADISLKAMSLGAVDCIGKPTTASNIAKDKEFQDAFLYKIRNIARPGSALRSGNKPQAGFLVKPKAKSQQNTAGATSLKPQYKTPQSSPGKITFVQKSKLNHSPAKLLAIGSSTGGPQALFAFLKAIKNPRVPIVITQHMPAMFTKILAGHIEQHTGHPCEEGEDGVRLAAGKIYVAPGGKHMLFEKKGDAVCVKLNDGPPENFCKPAVDPMIRSLQKIYGTSFLTVILTGMGSDGLKSAEEFVAAGGRLVAQDEKTSVVWGMPGAVAEAGICMNVLPLDELGPYVDKLI